MQIQYCMRGVASEYERMGSLYASKIRHAALLKPHIGASGSPCNCTLALSKYWDVHFPIECINCIFMQWACAWSLFLLELCWAYIPFSWKAAEVSNQTWLRCEIVAIDAIIWILRQVEAGLCEAGQMWSDTWTYFCRADIRRKGKMRRSWPIMNKFHLHYGPLDFLMQYRHLLDASNDQNVGATNNKSANFS